VRSPRWPRRALACAAALASLLTVAGAAGRSPDPRLRGVHTWALAIGDGDLSGNLLARYSGYDLLVLDGEGASARQVGALRRAGKIVLAYLDVGTIEPWRSWYPRLKRFRLDYLPDWGEWYVNVSAPGYRRAIVGTIAPQILRKGFGGLFLDNTDMIETHPAQAYGMRELVRALAGAVHARGAVLFTQNGDDSIGPTLSYYDGWNREDVTATYDFGHRRYVRQGAGEIRGASAALRRIAAAGLLVLSTDYVAAGDASATRLAVHNACAAGAIPFVSDIALTRVPLRPARCA
jgi:uncharacterized protein (TIGR01370 family)